MNKLEIKITEKESICLNILCLKCKNNFTTEIDIIHQYSENIPKSTTNILHCTNCESSYEYDEITNDDYLQVVFKNKKLRGTLEYLIEEYLEEERAPSIEKSKKFYEKQIKSFQKLLNIKSEEYFVEQSMNRLIFTGVITALETYLNEIYILIVFNSEDTVEKFITDYEPYKKEKAHDVNRLKR